MSSESGICETMGRVTTQARFENVSDVVLASQGQLPEDQVRAVNVDDALVDTGCTTIGLPKRLIDQLGLVAFSQKRVRGVTGSGTARVYTAVRLTIQDRSCTSDVFEIPDDVPVLIGQIPLEALDFVVDPRSQRLIGNPAHGGEHIIEAYSAGD
jgi:predicted aspartyl protease